MTLIPLRLHLDRIWKCHGKCANISKASVCVCVYVAMCNDYIVFRVSFFFGTVAAASDRLISLWAPRALSLFELGAAHRIVIKTSLRSLSAQFAMPAQMILSPAAHHTTFESRPESDRTADWMECQAWRKRTRTIGTNRLSDVFVCCLGQRHDRITSQLEVD